MPLVLFITGAAGDWPSNAGNSVGSAVPLTIDVKRRFAGLNVMCSSAAVTKFDVGSSTKFSVNACPTLADFVAGVKYRLEAGVAFFRTS